MRVTIVIPTMNKPKLLGACLECLRGLEVAIVVIDNGSDHETPGVLKQHPDVSVIRPVSNLGFARSCNAGARMATTDYLCFLNNDTEPQTSWLDPLVAILDKESTVGSVGPKLLFPDGTIQSGGIELVYDGDSLSRARECFRGSPGDKLSANVRRDALTTGACFLVRRELFNELGGFDERFQNGCEDVDLGLRIQAAGYRCVYEPASVVIHLESQTPGRMACVKQNRQLLREKWGKSCPSAKAS